MQHSTSPHLSSLNAAREKEPEQCQDCLFRCCCHLLLPEGAEHRSVTEKLQCWELDHQEKSQVLGTGSPGKEPGLFLAGEVVLAGGAVLCAPCQESVCARAALYLRQNIPLFLPFLRQWFLHGAQCQGVPL